MRSYEKPPNFIKVLSGRMGKLLEIAEIADTNAKTVDVAEVLTFQNGPLIAQQDLSI